MRRSSSRNSGNADDVVELYARDAEDDRDYEVYPRPPPRPEKPAKASRMTVGGGGSSDPAARYSSGRRADKDMSRYHSTLRNMTPMRIGHKSDVKGGAKIDESGLLSFVTYSWVFEYLYAAFRGHLDKDQVWQCSVYDASNVNMARMEVLWNEELAANPESPSLFKVTFRFIRTRLLAACGVFLFCLVFGFIGPTCFVRGLIAFAEHPPLGGEQIDYTFGFFLAGMLLFVEIARVLSYGATWAVSYRTGIRVRGALLGMLFKRVASVKNLQGKTSADVVNMFANDGQRLFDAITFAPLVIIGPLVLFGGIAYLLAVIGPWSMLGIIVFFIFDVIQYGLGKTMVRCRANAIEKTEKRINLMGEIIRCIRLIKMNGLEDNFIGRIEKMRHDEKVDIRTAGYAQSLAIACGPVVPVVAAILTFLGVVLSGNDLLASDAFSAITVFFTMLFGIRMIPYGSRYLAEAVVAIRRIQEMLRYEQFDSHLTECNDPNAAVVFKNATFSWTKKTDSPATNDEEAGRIVVDETSHALQGVELVVKKKELLGVCGSVGSGKSALLNSIIGHMHSVSGEVQVSGQVAYVPQQAWIQNATVQENILFGLPMAAGRYYKAIKAAQLTKDLEAMPANEQTEIGERGATLSGGQKARVSLARALFSHRDVYLLDDVLAAVDRKVADRIFSEAVQDMLSNKTVVMVTSDVERLARCDRVAFLEAGRLVAVGTHEELKEDCLAYQEYCKIAEENSAFAASSLDDSRLDARVGEKEQEEEGAEKKESKKDDGKLVEDEEDFGSAAVSWNVYSQYIAAAGSWVVLIVMLCAFMLNVVSSIFSTYWLSRWLKVGHDEKMVEENGTSTLRAFASLADSPDTSFYSTVYGISLVVLFLSGLLKATIFVKVSLNAASRLHNGMFSSVIRGATSFFDQTPTGRILNRFSKDMDEIDVKLPFTAEVFLQNMMTCAAFLAVIGWVFPPFLLACIPLLAVFVLFVLCFRAGIRSLKRSENISRSPLFDHITTTIDGLTCIHSYGQTNRFLETLKQRLDANSGAVFMFQSAMRWLAVWLDLLVVGITFVVAMLIVVLTGKVSPADAGMALAFAVQMSGIFQFAVRTQTELEAKMTSVERVAYYSENIQSDGEFDTRRGVDVPKDWPARGQVDFINVKLRYRLNLPLALNDVSFTVNAGEKVGIIGRTGSGKSSLGNVLFRLYPLSLGQIYVDGVDIATVGLKRLRRSMAVIPQDPVLFAGRIRENLDPLARFTDEQLWTALEKTYLKDMVSNLDGKLLASITAGGENMSVGQRQLFCMTRAILEQCKIVLLDEATASLDAATDKLIQKVLKEAFSSCTVLLIAHRLDSVADADRVLMMDGGRLVVFDTPDVVLRRATAALDESAEMVSTPHGSTPVMVTEGDEEGETAAVESLPDTASNADDSESPEIVNGDSADDIELVEK